MKANIDDSLYNAGVTFVRHSVPLYALYLESWQRMFFWYL